MHHVARNRPAGGAAVAIALMLGAGCGQELDRFQYPTRTLAGQVTFQGRPVTSGWVEFVPTHGTVGNIVSARLGAGGRYTARAVAVGNNQVKIVHTRPPLPDEFSSDDSKLVVTIAPDGRDTRDFHLP